MAKEKASQSKNGYDLVADNRKARHDFFIEEALEAGLALTGTEVKSLRGHRVNLRDSYARIHGLRHWPNLNDDVGLLSDGTRRN